MSSGSDCVGELRWNIDAMLLQRWKEFVESEHQIVIVAPARVADDVFKTRECEYDHIADVVLDNLTRITLGIIG